jgi:hypothetical protein
MSDDLLNKIPIVKLWYLLITKISTLGYTTYPAYKMHANKSTRVSKSRLKCKLQVLRFEF